MTALRPLGSHQERALESLRASLASGHCRPMLQAPTGFGKTLTAAHIIQRALDKGKRVAFIVPALSLIDQTVGAFEAEGKDQLLILDHAGNHLRLGMVTDIGADRLDDGRERRTGINRKREQSERLPKRCDECSAIVSRAARACPSCGAPIRAKTEVESAEGDLVEFGSHRAGAATPSIGDKISFHGELLWIARERGHKPGWIGFKFKERFGVWPNDPRVRSAFPRPPSLKTKNWVTSRAIAFAKARERVAYG